MLKACWFVAMGAGLALAGSAAAQTWAEVADAPDGVPGHQRTFGVGPLTSITGVVNRAGGDHVDTYSIIITDVALFYATTKIFYGGSALTQTGGNADTRLWLWSETGAPLLANDDINGLPGDTLASLVSSPGSFPGLTGGELVNPTAAGITLVAGQKYLLSISEFANDPDGAGGVDMFLLGSDFDALHGPNPAAGAFVGWENAADSTIITYNIRLAGATFCPTPGALGLLAGSLLVGMGRRRRA